MSSKNVLKQKLDIAERRSIVVERSAKEKYEHCQAMLNAMWDERRAERKAVYHTLKNLRADLEVLRFSKSGENMLNAVLETFDKSIEKLRKDVPNG